jgi:hypothetical protein
MQQNEKNWKRTMLGLTRVQITLSVRPGTPGRRPDKEATLTVPSSRILLGI